MGGFNGGVGANKSKENEDGNTHTESVISASGTTTLKSGNDTNITGSQVKGEKVVADVGGNLNIGSQQDTDTYTEKSKNSGINFDTGNRGGTHGSTNTGKINSNYSSVIEQAGIYAGKQGFTINVGKNTDLKGAVIASEATPDKNKLSTDTLTYSDIENKAEYSASSSGFGVGISKDGKITGSPTPSMPVNGSADSTTKSAISPGTIDVRSGNADLSNLNRDPSNALNSLGKIFDKKTVQEKQELVNLFSQEANKAIGDLAYSMWKNAKTQEERDKWGEGGEYKALLHAVAAGITSSMAGEGFASGAMGDGISQLAQKQLANITDKNLRLLVSAAIGAAAAKVVGGNAQAGASAAYNGVKYNDQAHSVPPGTIVKGPGGFYTKGDGTDDEYINGGLAPGTRYWDAEKGVFCRLEVDGTGTPIGKPGDIIYDEQGNKYEIQPDGSDKFKPSVSIGDLLNNPITQNPGLATGLLIGSTLLESEILKDAIPGRVTKGKATQWEKSGGYNQALNDFNSMGVQNIRDIPGGKVGTLPDGRTINVRTKSSDGRPTLEIFDGKNSTKIRYNE